MDTRQFNTGLTAAAKRLEQFAERATAVLTKVQAVSKQTEAAFQNIKLPEIKPNITVNLKGSGLKVYQAEAEGAAVKVDELAAKTEQLGGKAAAAKPKLEGAGDGARRLGKDSSTAAPGVERLQDAISRLQQVGALLVTGAGIFTFFKRLDNSAAQSNSATIGLNLFNRELAKNNELAADGEAAVQRLAKRFKIQAEDIRGDAAGIERYGATLEQTEEILLRAGASAVIRGRSFAAGSNAANEALNGEYSAVLNLIGVSGNLSTYFQRLAKSLGVTTDQLTRQQKVEAFLTLLRAETQTEVEALSEIYVGYGAAVQNVSTAEAGAARKTGTVVIPVLTLLKNTYADLLNLYSALPRLVQALTVATATLGVVTGGLLIIYAALRTLLFNQKTLGPIIAGLLKNETLLRSRLGAVIIVQARAYGLLDKAQVRSAVTARSAALANAAGAGSATKLASALTVLSKLKGFLALGVLVAFIREAVKYVSVFQPLVTGLGTQLERLGQLAPVKKLRELLGSAKELQTFFSEFVLNTVTLASLALAGLGLRIEQTGVQLQFLADVVSKGPAEASRLLQQRLTALDAKYGELTDSILDNAVAHQTQIRAGKEAAATLNLTADAAQNATNALEALSEEDRRVFDELKDRTGELTMDLSVDLNSGDLQQQVTSVTSEIDTIIAEIQKKSATLQDNGPLRYLLTGLELDLRELRGAAIADTYVKAVQNAQDEATQAQIAALEDGSVKINATYYERIEQDRRAFESLTKGLAKDSRIYQDLLAAFNSKVAAITAQGNRELKGDAQARLESARAFREQLDGVAAELAKTQTDGSDDALVRLRGQFAASAQSIRDDTQKLLRDVADKLQGRVISEEEASADVQRIGSLQTARLAQNQVELTHAVNAELQKRKNSVADYYSAVSSAEAAATAQRQREGGDDLGAVQTELTERLRLINQALARELQTEGLTRGQIVALNAKAESDRVQARAEAGRQIDDLARDEVARERTLQNELRAVRQGSELAGLRDSGKERAAAAVEQQGILADLRSSLAEQLAAVGLSEAEKVDIRRLNAAKVLAAQDEYTRKLTGFAQAEAQAVQDAQEQARQARDGAIEGSIPQLVRQFAQERAARLRADQETLEDFEGTYSQRQQIVAAQGQREVTQAKVFAGQLLREQRSALSAYQQAVVKAEAEILQARETAAEGALSAAQKVTDFSVRRVDRTALRNEMQAYDALQTTLAGTVSRSNEVVDAARIRARSAQATADDVGALVAAENAAVAAQGRVVDATQAQIDRLKGLRDAQLEIVRGGSDVLAFSDAASKISGRDQDSDQVTRFINEQQEALVKVLQQQERNNVPVRDQLATLQEIAALEERLREGGKRGLSQDQISYIDTRQAELLREFPADASAALRASNDISGQLQSLTTQLGDAQQKFTDLLGSVGQSSVLDIQVRIDDRQIRQDLAGAEQALGEVFGTEAAARISRQFAAGLSLEQVLKSELESATGMVERETDSAGASAGAGLMSAFAAGISDNSDLVVSAVTRALQRVRELLPSSDAKRGPLSDLTYSGGKTVTTYAAGIREKFPALSATVTQMASIAKPAMSVPTTMMLPGLAGAGAGDIYNTFHLGDAPFQPDAMAERDGQRFAQAAMRTVKTSRWASKGKP